jgi:FkbM family methyltransferase
MLPLECAYPTQKRGKEMLISVSELALNFGCKPKVVWHLGGHNAEELSDYLNNGTEEIHWFEANPDQVLVLQGILSGIRGQHLIPKAAWHTDGDSLAFNITNKSMSSSLYELDLHSEKYPDIVLAKTINVDTITLNSYSIGREVPNFINLDIQGAELEALKGASKLLHRVAYIYTEVSFLELYKNAPLADEIDSYLQSFGFKRVVTRKVPRDGWADVLYINQSLVKLPMHRIINRLRQNVLHVIRNRVYEFRLKFHELRKL